MWVIWDGSRCFLRMESDDSWGWTYKVGEARKFSTPADAYIFAEWRNCPPDWVPIKIEDIPARAA